MPRSTRISSIELEAVALGHPDVLHAAVSPEFAVKKDDQADVTAT
jgi:hypothetical protein